MTSSLATDRTHPGSARARLENERNASTWVKPPDAPTPLTSVQTGPSATAPHARPVGKTPTAFLPTSPISDGDDSETLVLDVSRLEVVPPSDTTDDNTDQALFAAGEGSEEEPGGTLSVVQPEAAPIPGATVQTPDAQPVIMVLAATDLQSDGSLHVTDEDWVALSQLILAVAHGRKIAKLYLQCDADLDVDEDVVLSYVCENCSAVSAVVDEIIVVSDGLPSMKAIENLITSGWSAGRWEQVPTLDSNPFN